MFKLAGEKSNLSSGMASARSTICFSTALISRSTAAAMVGTGCCPHALISAAKRKTMRIGFIEVTLLNSCLAKRNQRIHLCRAPGGKVAGQHRDCQQKHSHGQKDPRVMWAYAVQDAGHHRDSQCRQNHTRRYSGRSQDRAL